MPSINDGAEVVVTLLDYPKKKVKKIPVDWDSFAIPSERGKNVAVVSTKRLNISIYEYDLFLYGNTKYSSIVITDDTNFLS